jgi:predicted nucleotidyltransferase component of viral defense system
MIDKRELLTTATRVSLQPHVIEKDYVLGWMLAGIYAHEELAESWIFKGGTCLKKCFFETYRFSEDLDFTLRDPAHINSEFLTRVFREIGAWIYDETGIEVPPEKTEFDIYINPRGTVSCQGKISYRGPISSPHALPRIKLDLTADERVVLPAVQTRIFHPYSDEPEGGITVLSYDYIEAFAEKFRALAERTRPRDLYDVVNLFRNAEARPEPGRFRAVLLQKCDFKGIGLPRLIDLLPHRPDLEAGWSHMLAHQLPALLPVNAFWDELPTIFDWLNGTVPIALPEAPASIGAGPIIRERMIATGLGPSAESRIETIRFAGANRLVVDLDYIDKEGRRSTRLIEPYSFRRSQAGDVRLMAVQAEDSQPRSFLIDGIQAVRMTQRTFTPRYPIELTPSGLQPIPQSEPSVRSWTSPGPRPGTRTRIAHAPMASRFLSNANSGPTYIFRCLVCGKEFSRKSMDSNLNPHKNRAGYACYGTLGTFVRTKR